MTIRTKLIQLADQWFNYGPQGWPLVKRNPGGECLPKTLFSLGYVMGRRACARELRQFAKELPTSDGGR